MKEESKSAVRKYTIETIGYMNEFERIARCKVIDCIATEDGLLFFVESWQIGKIIGTKGENLRKIEARFNKKVRIIGYDEDVVKFVRNIVYPVKPKDIAVNGNKLVISAGDTRSKGMLIGRDRKNLKRLQELVSRYFSYTIEII